MKKPVTIYIEEKELKDAKKLAIDLNTSFTQLVAGLIRARLMKELDKKK